MRNAGTGLFAAWLTLVRIYRNKPSLLLAVFFLSFLGEGNRILCAIVGGKGWHEIVLPSSPIDPNWREILGLSFERPSLWLWGAVARTAWPLDPLPLRGSGLNAALLVTFLFCAFLAYSHRSTCRGTQGYRFVAIVSVIGLLWSLAACIVALNALTGISPTSGSLDRFLLSEITTMPAWIAAGALVAAHLASVLLQAAGAEDCCAGLVWDRVFRPVPPIFLFYTAILGTWGIADLLPVVGASFHVSISMLAFVAGVIKTSVILLSMGLFLFPVVATQRAGKMTQISRACIGFVLERPGCCAGIIVTSLLVSIIAQSVCHVLDTLAPDYWAVGNAAIATLRLVVQSWLLVFFSNSFEYAQRK